MSESLLTEQLIREIGLAFADVHRGTGISWREAEEIDCHGDAQDRLNARRMDQDERWQDVDVSVLDAMPSAVYFLDALGFRYYLPAFMISDLRRSGKWTSAVDDNFESRLGSREFCQALSPILSIAQKQAVMRWLQVEQGRYPWHESVVLRDWEQYCLKGSDNFNENQ